MYYLNILTNGEHEQCEANGNSICFATLKTQIIISIDRSEGGNIEKVLMIVNHTYCEQNGGNFIGYFLICELIFCIGLVQQYIDHIFMKLICNQLSTTLVNNFEIIKRKVIFET